jgi:predicted ester cyclase
MSPGTNKAIIRRMIEQVWNERRLDLYEEFFTENVVQHPIGIISKSGLESVKEDAGMILKAYPDLQYAIDDEIAEGDKVVNRWMMTSALHGELNVNLANGKKVIRSGVTIFRLSNARIDELWIFTDNLELMHQIAVAPWETD